jgi:hypothetical protein
MVAPDRGDDLGNESFAIFGGEAHWQPIFSSSLIGDCGTVTIRSVSIRRTQRK